MAGIREPGLINIRPMLKALPIHAPSSKPIPTEPLRSGNTERDHPACKGDDPRTHDDAQNTEQGAVGESRRSGSRNGLSDL